MKMNEQDRIEHDLRSFRRWTARLRWFVAACGSPDLTELDQRECEAFPFEWADVVDRFAGVARTAAQGKVKSDALAELRGIAGELTELLPAMKRLRLRLPDLEALERAVDPATPQRT